MLAAALLALLLIALGATVVFAVCLAAAALGQAERVGRLWRRP